MAQESLFAFDKSSKKSQYKIVFRNGNHRRVLYEPAYDEGILRQKYPDAEEIKKL